MCYECDVSFGIKPDVKRHIEMVHEGKKPFVCSKCKGRFVNKQGLNRHIESVYERKKPFKCEICDYSCSQKRGCDTFGPKHSSKTSPALNQDRP